MTVLFITHDIGQACYLADRVLVMEHGVMVEQGTVDEVIFNPQHEYTKRLLADVPKLHEEIELHIGDARPGDGRAGLTAATSPGPVHVQCGGAVCCPEPEIVLKLRGGSNTRGVG